MTQLAARTFSNIRWPFIAVGESDQKKNDGFLLLVAVKDRKYYTQVGYHLEGDLNDGLVGQIQREYLVPQFKKGNYSQGIYDTVQAYVATLAAEARLHHRRNRPALRVSCEAPEPPTDQIARRADSPVPAARCS